MAEESNHAKTAFDEATQQHQLEIIKAAIPYINTSEQKVISIYVKVSELADTIKIFQKPKADIGICSQGENSGSMLDMLNDIKSVCTNTEQETINMIINYFNAFQMYRTYQQSCDNDENDTSQPNSSNMFENLKGLLTPEQQQMFETYNVMFNSL